jgi:carboxymethylenebutenolidase
VQPGRAETINTSASGLIVGPVQVPVADGHIPAYMAQPERPGTYPIILVVHEIFDLHEYIQDICRRLAKQDYVVIAPSLFAREGDATKMPDVQSIVKDIATKVPDAQALSDLDSALKYAAANGGDGDRAGITGFCWGGRITWLYDAHNPNLKAAVAWYGMVGDSPFGQTRPLDIVPRLTAPILGLYGGKDDSIPTATLDAMRAELKQDGKTGNIVVYPAAGHGFFADYRPSYDAQAAEDAWQRCLGWFRKYLAE